MMITLLAALAATANVPAHANWAIVAESDEGVMAIDPASVAVDGDRRSVWTRAAFLDEQGMATTVVVLADVDCRLRTMAKRRTIAIDDAGMAQEAAAIDTTPQPIGEGSIGAAIFDNVCR